MADDQVPTSVRAAYSRFALWIANGTVGHPLLAGTDYSAVLTEPSAMEQVFAVFGNVLRIGPDGEVRNAREAERRAALYLYGYCHGWDRLPAGEAPLTDDETERHG